MKAMLLLTDFSDAAFRAAEYGSNLAGFLHVDKLILYHTYRTIAEGIEFPVPSPKVSGQLYLENMQALAAMQDQLRMVVAGDISYELLAEDAFLPKRINQLCKEQGVEIIVMGVSGKSNKDGLFMGANTSRLLKASKYPVLIVPKDTYVSGSVKSVVFSTDFQELPSAAANQLCRFLDAVEASVHVVNVSPEIAEQYLTKNKVHLEWLRQLLEKYHPDFHYIVGNDVVKGILDFSREHHVSMMITVPRQHAFLSAIFHKSISKELAYNTQLPLLSLPAR
ncbi:universal stress protein [Chitinophaga sp. 30R24]|uniref:universal stress protein n=1 Tax=Chitinophaga sp. 30R24 TaxID=3248838 RepID=UPI003B90A156